MDAPALLSHVFDDAGYQLTQVFSGMTPESQQAKLHPDQMSAQETLVHLTEAHIAGQKDLKGEKHEWGSYTPEETNFDVLLANLKAEREKFKAQTLAAGTEEAYKEAMSYGANHDYYHVGQMVLVRIATEPTWNSYSIYR